MVFTLKNFKNEGRWSKKYSSMRKIFSKFSKIAINIMIHIKKFIFCHSTHVKILKKLF